MFADICETTLYVKDNKDVYCGFFLAGNITWNEANEQCQSRGARLPQAESLRENHDIFDRQEVKVFA